MAMKTKAILSLIAVLFCLWVGTSFAADRDTPGAVYAMTNAAGGNEIIIFDRKANGELTEVGTIATDGDGSGGGLDPLGSQGSLVLSQDHRWLLAVNAGSDEISVFKVLPEGLSLVDVVGSGGDFPVSVTIYHDLVYVLNASTPNITAFTLSFAGELTPVANSTRSLGSGAFAQVGFDPQGNNLVVTDKGEREILVFSLESDGTPSAAPVTTASSGVAPFGFIFDRRGHLLVSEAGSGAASSYRILPDDTLEVISASVPNGEAATCWIAGNKRGDIFTSNTASGSVSAYKLLAGNGRLLLRDPTASVAPSSPIDIAITADGRFLYALDPGAGSVHMFRIDRDGGLTDLDAITPVAGLSIFANGIAAR
jgi:6-phosphogluconolactonase (cycloisomerase 2 family)